MKREREREREGEGEGERGFMHQSPMKPLKRFHRAWVSIHDLCYICLLSFFLVLFFFLKWFTAHDEMHVRENENE